jgi:hypothetical protein
MSTTSSTASLTSQQVSDWFENLISHIRVDQVSIELGVANDEKSEFYTNLISGKQEEVFKKIRFDASQLLIEKVVRAFVGELSSRKVLPLKLAFALTPSTIMVWSEISDDDERVEDGILLSEAKVNAYAKQFDFAVDTMIVEQSDKLPIPSHYTELKNYRRQQQSLTD